LPSPLKAEVVHGEKVQVPVFRVQGDNSGNEGKDERASVKYFLPRYIRIKTRLLVFH
jgi:hypothetical protein